jgi:hypothetical protein
MQPGARVNDDFMCRGRFLRREWKRYKPVSVSCSYPVSIPPDINFPLIYIASSEIDFIARVRIGPR